MILGSGKQLLSIVVLGFALMGFIAVPIFDQSAYEHLRELLTSEEARAAGQEIRDSVGEVRERIVQDLGEDDGETTQGKAPSSEPLVRRQRHDAPQ